MFSAEQYIRRENPVATDERPARLRAALQRAVVDRPADALLLSGGIDSAMLAALDPKTPAITVVLENKGVDLQNAQRVTEQLGTPWHNIQLTKEESLRDLQEIMKLTNSYDPGLLNDIPIYHGLKYAASLGWRTIRTGDAADTIFGGYAYLPTGEAFHSYLRKVIPQIRLASSRIGKNMGIKMEYPYLDPEILSMALTITPEENMMYFDTDKHGDFFDKLGGSVEKSKRWGKVVLRRAAQGLLPNSTVWRTKTDLEFGSGMYELEEELANVVESEDISLYGKEGKRFWNKMHAGLYTIYKELDLEPEPKHEGEYGCSWCGGGVIDGRRHCHTCGAYPANQAELFVLKNDTKI